MSRVINMVRMGLHEAQAKAIAAPSGGTCTLAAAGNSWATGTAITAEAVFVTSAQDGTTGISLPAVYEIGDRWMIATKDNSGSSACILYPPTGAQINNLSANSTYSITDAKAVLVTAVAAGRFIVLGL